MRYVNLTPECVRAVEQASPLSAGVECTVVGTLCEVPIDEAWYARLRKERRPTEDWSDVVLRFLRVVARRAEQRRAAGLARPAPRPILLSSGTIPGRGRRT